MILSFADKNTEELFFTGKNKRFSAISKIALRKLYLLGSAEILNDLRFPPANHLEKLKGDLSEFHSIRINGQWRIVFRWTPQGAVDVKIADYH